MCIYYVQSYHLHLSPTYPWVGTDTAVQSSIIAGNSKGIDQWLRELRSLFEVVIFKILHFYLQTCGGGRHFFRMIRVSVHEFPMRCCISLNREHNAIFQESLILSPFPRAMEVT